LPAAAPPPVRFHPTNAKQSGFLLTMMFAKLPKYLALAALLGAVAPTALAPTAMSEDKTANLPALDPEKNPYNIRNGKVDFETYNGFRRYGGACARCHGPSGTGSSFAPNLTESVKRLSYAEFVNVVVNGRKPEGASQNSVMPAFGTNPNVIKHIDDIWGYLNARADGAIGPGRPERIR
jgi:methanol metabolism-related c-type cytochrome